MSATRHLVFFLAHLHQAPLHLAPPKTPTNPPLRVLSDHDSRSKIFISLILWFRQFRISVQQLRPLVYARSAQQPALFYVELFFFFCKTSPKSLLESPQEASPSYNVTPTSQVTVSGWGSREEKGAVDSGFAFV